MTKLGSWQLRDLVRRKNRKDQLDYSNLEARQVLATVSLVGSVLNIFGTQLQDIVSAEVSQSGQITIADNVNADQTFSVSAVDSIRFFGNDGDDEFRASGTTTEIPAVEFYGMSGDDLFDFQMVSPSSTLITSIGVGGEGDDTLTATTTVGQQVQFFGSAGSDTISGGAGDDYIEGGLGNDFLSGGTGEDEIRGDVGDDTIKGDEGDDSLFGGLGSDDIEGGASSNDPVTNVERPGGNDTIFGGEGDDTIQGGVGEDLIYGGEGMDSLFGDEGDDLILGGDGHDKIFGGEGDDTIHGQNGNDLAEGQAGVDRLFGGSGEDHLNAGTGNDFVYGGPDSDILTGGTGDDVLNGFLGNDEIQGNQGVDRLVGGDGDDQLDGSEDVDTLLGESGVDVLLGGSGDDILFGGQDRDTLDGGRDIDWLSGGTEIDFFLDTADDQISDLENLESSEFVVLEFNAESQTVSVSDSSPTISVTWDLAVQQAVIETKTGPTIASRAYAMVHTAIYDAWSAYDDIAISTQLNDDLQRPLAENTDANKTEAMSFAAYRVLVDLFSDRKSIFDSVMNELGFDSDNTSTDSSTPVGIGNQMAAALLEFRHNDGSNQLGDDSTGTAGVAYSDITDYEPINATGDSSIIDAWTPEYVPIDAIPGTEDRIQEFLTPHWGEVTSFDQNSSDQFLPSRPQPFLLVDGTVDLDAKTITLIDGTVLDIDKSLIGSVINPEFISQAEEVIEISSNLTDKQKLIAEFWEDGGGTSFPPGTFMTFGEFVSARDDHSIDQDAQMFFALGNAVFDAGVATWGAKVEYDYVRPVRAIRDLGELGLIGEFDSALGGYAVEAWTPDEGTQTILATEFLTYQTPGSDVSPPFAEYTSGHSAFSAAGATVLKMFTGSDALRASVTFEQGESRFEVGETPSSSVTLFWDSFGTAADEAGLSRLYGGIHFNDGDVNGRTLGKNIGEAVWNQAQFYINGGIT